MATHISASAVATHRWLWTAGAICVSVTPTPQACTSLKCSAFAQSDEALSATPQCDEWRSKVIARVTQKSLRRLRMSLRLSGSQPLTRGSSVVTYRAYLAPAESCMPNGIEWGVVTPHSASQNKRLIVASFEAAYTTFPHVSRWSPYFKVAPNPIPQTKK